jgi:hypothetical protein
MFLTYHRNLLFLIKKVSGSDPISKISISCENESDPHISDTSDSKNNILYHRQVDSVMYECAEADISTVSDCMNLILPTLILKPL